MSEQDFDFLRVLYQGGLSWVILILIPAGIGLCIGRLRKKQEGGLYWRFLGSVLALFIIATLLYTGILPVPI